MDNKTEEEPQITRNATLVFLVQMDEDGITRVCLAMKKRGFGERKYNGVGGKVDKNLDKSIEEGALREAKEEIGVNITGLNKVGELQFDFPHKPEWNQLVHVYLATDWEDEIIESEEMKPEWFDVNQIPYDSMWPDDTYWLPEILQGLKVKGTFTFGEGDIIQNSHVDVVESFK